MACGGIITPTLGIAAAGMLNGSGLSISNLNSAVSAVASAPLVSAATDAVAAAPVALAGMGAASPLAFVANAVPQDLAASVASIVPDAKVLTGAVQGWGSAVFGDSVGKFAQTFTQLQGFATNAFQVMGAVDVASKLNFSDLGIDAKNYVDVVSGGLGNLVSSVVPNVQNALGSLASDIQKTGALLNFGNLSQLGSPGSLVTNLVNNGLGNVGGIADKLVSAGVNLADINNPVYNNVIQKVLNTVSGADLQNIASKLDAVLPDTVRSAADLLSVEKLLPSVPVSFGSFGELGNKLSAFAQESGFKDSENFSNLLKQVEIPSLPELKTITQVMPDSVKQIYTSTFGSGTGPFNNPTLTDMLGTVTGINLKKSQDVILAAIEAIAELPEGAELQAIAESMIGADPLELPGLKSDYENKLDEIAAISDPALQELFTSAGSAWYNQAQGIVNEKTLMDQAGVDFDFRSGTDKNVVFSLAANLHESGIDQFQLNSNEIFESLATSDVYGDAVKAGLVEGRNLQRMLELGFQSTNKITVR